MKFTNGNVAGADVSYYQNDRKTPQQIDFSKMVGQEADFVIIRAGQNLWVDPDFNYNWRNARVTGLPRGSYWFYDSRADPIRQAELFALQFRSDVPELDLWLDIEERYNGTYSGYKYWKIFLNRLRELMPQTPIGIYTSYGYIKGRIPQSEFAYFLKFPLWLAWWTDRVADVIIPAPWTSCLYWQWGTPNWGLAWGCESIEIDMNLFNGTLEDFQTRYNLKTEGDIDMASDEAIKYLADQNYKGLHEVAQAIAGISIPGGGGGTPPPATKESDYNVIENDSNINGLIVAYKTPDVNETNVDRFPVKPPQVVTAINDWKDVPAGLVGWSQMNDIERQNTYRNWVCLHENQIKNANGNWRAFPDIFLQGGTVRAEYCWMLRSCLGSKV